MNDRDRFNSFLKEYTECGNVYYQPPESIKILYPCLMYELSGTENLFADNLVYASYDVYKVTVSDPDPESSISQKLKSLPFANFERSYVEDNLNHFVFYIKNTSLLKRFL